MRISNKNTFYIFFFIILFFFIIEFNGLDHIEPGDEHTYFYMGKLITQGILPYRDFFASRPPLQLYLISVIYKIFGFNLVALKLVPLLSTIISAFFIFKIMKKYSNITAIVSVLLFLFSHRVMLEATYFLGINETTMFTVIGLYYLISRKRYLLSGIFFGLAGITGLYSLIPSFVIFIVLFIKNKKLFLKFLIGFSIIFLLTNLIFILWNGVSYIHSVYIWHFFKPKIQGATSKMFIDYFLKNIFLVISALLVLFVKEKKEISIGALISIFYLLFLIAIRSFNFYFVLLAPFLAVLGGYSLVNLLKRFRKKNNFVISFILLILFALYSLNIFLYLQNFDFVDFQSKDILVKHITGNSNPNDKIYGDVTFTPMAALLTNRSIAFNEVDTNAQRFLSGSLNFDEVLKKIKEEKVKFVIVRPTIGFGNNQKVADFLKSECKFSNWIKDKYFGDIIIYDCSQSNQ